MSGGALESGRLVGALLLLWFSWFNRKMHKVLSIVPGSYMLGTFLGSSDGDDFEGLLHQVVSQSGCSSFVWAPGNPAWRNQEYMSQK